MIDSLENSYRFYYRIEKITGAQPLLIIGWVAVWGGEIYCSDHLLIDYNINDDLLERISEELKESYKDYCAKNVDGDAKDTGNFNINNYKTGEVEDGLAYYTNTLTDLQDKLKTALKKAGLV